MKSLRAPFPYFGGKSRAAHLVWAAFGDPANYVEPFAGSLAVLLSRPTQARIETCNDINAYLSNFWRATTAAPEDVARWADWPVNEVDLHARHRWLVYGEGAPEFREAMKHDPDLYDAKRAGWWDGLLCAACGAVRGDSKYPPTFHLDHVIPLCRGGVNALFNFQLLCETCNVRKGSQMPVPPVGVA